MDKEQRALRNIIQGRKGGIVIVTVLALA